MLLAIRITSIYKMYCYTNTSSSFLKPKWVHKTGCAVRAIYASCAGTEAHRHNNRKMMMTNTSYI